MANAIVRSSFPLPNNQLAYVISLLPTVEDVKNARLTCHAFNESSYATENKEALLRMKMLFNKAFRSTCFGCTPLKNFFSEEKDVIFRKQKLLWMVHQGAVSAHSCIGINLSCHAWQMLVFMTMHEIGLLNTNSTAL